MNMHPSLCVPIQSVIQVPADYIAATASGRKKCKSIKGTAGRKRMRIIAENKCNEKKLDSKVGFLSGTNLCKSPVKDLEAVPVIQPLDVTYRQLAFLDRRGADI